VIGDATSAGDDSLRRGVVSRLSGQVGWPGVRHAGDAMRFPRTPDAVTDRINTRTYRARRVVRYYGSTSGWLDTGERVAMEFACSLGAGPPLLDIGVGGGRTVPLLQAISAEYVGIDYVPEMIEVARERFPGVDLCVMDARQLDFPDASFGFAAFTFNGLDSVSEQGRSIILSEVRRVLRPGGVFVFSALNHHGAVDRVLLTPPKPDSWQRPRRLARWSMQQLQTVMNLQRMRRLVREEADASIRPVRAHAGGLIGRYTSLARQCDELVRHGFKVAACLDPQGMPADPGGNHSTFAHFHYVARTDS